MSDYKVMLGKAPSERPRDVSKLVYAAIGRTFPITWTSDGGVYTDEVLTASELAQLKTVCNANGWVV